MFQKNLFYIFFLFSLMTNSAFSESTLSTRVTNENESYKDSFYFSYEGQKYLVVSTLSGSNGVSLLKAHNNNDYDYRFFKTIISGNYWAPIAVHQNGGTFTIVTSHIVNTHDKTIPPSLNYLEYFRYDMNSFQRKSEPRRLILSGGELGMIDATIWYEENNQQWYLIGSKWQPNVDGSRLQWAHGNNIEGPYTFPKDLYSEPNVLDDGTFRVDYWQGGEKTHWVVEAPIWSWWDHNGNGFHELYWSVGSSDPCETTGWSYIRRGDIKWSGTTPWIDILPGRILSENGTCNLLTHPDFTETGAIRATSFGGGVFGITNQPFGSW